MEPVSGARTTPPRLLGIKPPRPDTRPGVVIEQSVGFSLVPPKQATHQRVPSELVAQQIAGTWVVKGGREPPVIMQVPNKLANSDPETGVRTTSARAPDSVPIDSTKITLRYF